jgi:hypothetical protein
MSINIFFIPNKKKETKANFKLNFFMKVFFESFFNVEN